MILNIKNNQCNKEKQFRMYTTCLLIFTLKPLRVTNLNNNTPESHTKVIRVKEMITN